MLETPTKPSPSRYPDTRGNTGGASHAKHPRNNPAVTRRRADVDLTLGQRRRRCPNVKSTLAQRLLVSSGNTPGGAQMWLISRAVVSGLRLLFHKLLWPPCRWLLVVSLSVWWAFGTWPQNSNSLFPFTTARGAICCETLYFANPGKLVKFICQSYFFISKLININSL